MPRAQTGYALLILMLVLVLGGTAFFLGARDPGETARAREGVVATERLRTAGDAVIAYAAFRDSEVSPVPGALPCPDYNDPGGPDAGGSTPSDCNGEEAVYWKRFPWREVETSRELAGFWYAIDGAFFREDAAGDVLNPNTATGSLTVDGSGEYAAVVIDPNATAGAPAAVLADDNANGDVNFVNCKGDDGCEDRVYGIGSGRLLDLVRRRVLVAVQQGLETFFDEHDHYPWAAPLGDPDGACDESNARRTGTLPFTDGSCTAHLGAHDFDHDPMPSWVQANNWDEIVPLYYAVGCEHVPDPSRCDAAEPNLLSLSGEGASAVVFGDAGSPIESAAKEAMQDRSGGFPHDVLEYLDSDVNTDEDGEFNDPENGEGENDWMSAIQAP